MKIPEFFTSNTVENIFKNSLAGQTFLGIDVGSSCVGVAIAARGSSLASPLTWFQRTTGKSDADHMQQIFINHGVNICVFGYPLTLLGEERESCRQVALFAKLLVNYSAFDNSAVHSCIFWDERMSTQAAKRVVIQGKEGMRRLQNPRQRKWKEQVDKYSAVYVLQNFLDRLPAIQ
eukprot:jgi/Galph1/2482/GphlegSOOS_G1136.1